ncbi:MAG: EF2563 family selenium-dependent molybdenum hydroxylase system protein [Anaerolineales bacterium]|nr:MAG: EF2563 family selenium-dependent molybdenum hydroxylase system protein [Anaerolineales bacterium]
MEDILVVVKGGGDLATGVAHRLHRVGMKIIITELAQPTVIRRAVAFASAVFEGEVTVEGVVARRVEDAAQALALLPEGIIPVLVDPGASVLRPEPCPELVLSKVEGQSRRVVEGVRELRPSVVVDAIIAKRNTGTRITDAPVVVALGPGFTAGLDAHAVIETNRGHDLGRVILEGQAVPDTGIPGPVMGYASERVVRAPGEGVFRGVKAIGDRVEAGDVVARAGGQPVLAPISGVLRGLLADGLLVKEGMKVGDVDPRGVRGHCFTISDKARALGGSVLEAILYLLREREERKR